MSPLRNKETSKPQAHSPVLAMVLDHGKKQTGPLSYVQPAVQDVVIEQRFRSPISVVAAKYSITSTITSWETQLKRMNKATCFNTARGIHLRSGSRRELTYPKEVDQTIYEWVLFRQDSHLPVSRDLIKAKAFQLVKKHNPNFVANTGWLQKFMSRHGYLYVPKHP